MNLSPHFSLAEMCNSQTAQRQGIDNEPSQIIVERLRFTCAGLERIRSIVGCPIVVSSGYRSTRLNQAVGGAVNSQHVEGYAADITAPAFGHPVNLIDEILRSGIDFDQCILEHCNTVTGTGWIHVSFTHTPRKQALIIDASGTRVYA